MTHPRKPLKFRSKATPVHRAAMAKPLRVQDMLGKLCQDLRLDERAREFALKHLWLKHCPERYHPYCRIKRLYQTKEGYQLEVIVTSPLVMTELSFHLDALRLSLNQYQKQTGVRIERIRLSGRN